MVTFARAQERAEEWINGDLPSYQHREVRVREFDLGFVVWAEDRADGPRSDGGAQRLVIARDSGEATLWPGLPVGEVIRRYEEEYGRPDAVDEPAPAPPARVDLNQTSFLLTPPEWLQDAADKLGIPDRRGAAAPSGSTADSASGSGASWPAAGGSDSDGSGAPGAPAGPVAPAAPAGATPWAGTDTNGDGGDDRSVPLPATVFAPPLSEADDDTPPPATASDAKTALIAGGSQLPRTAVTPAVDGPGPGVDAQGAAPGVPGTPPQGVPGTPPAGVPQGSTPPPAPSGQPYGYPQPPAGPGVPERPLAPNAGDIADAATSKATPPPGRGRGTGPTTPPPPGAPGTPGARPGDTPPPPPSGPGAPGTPAGGYVPTQMVSALGPEGPGGPVPQGPGAPPPPQQPPGAPSAPGAPQPPGAPGGTPPGGVHHAATMFADPGRPGPGVPQPPGPPGAPGVPQPPQPPGPPGAPGAPGAPQPPGAPNAPGAGPVHHAETMLAAPPPAGGPGVPPPPQAPGAPPGAPPMPPGAMPPGAVPPGAVPPPGQPVPGPPQAYGYPQPPAGQPTVGPGYQAVLRYRAQDGSEQQLIRRSAPGTPHPEWQIFHELRAMNVPPDQVLELHTELESCELPGAYCARMIREQWPQARITSIAPYGTDHASRQQGMQQLLAHQGELHQVADGPARPAPVRAPLPPVQAAPPVPPEAIAQELAAAFGPGVFRFEQAAVSRQGVPPVVAHTLVAAGLPMDMGPFFWAQAQPGRPVPTLAELAAERGVQPASDAGSYLVMGSDFGKAICVQYGTANIVAVPVEAGPGGAPVPPQFVNTGLPEFARCLALLGRMWRLRFGLNQEQAGRWTVDFQAQLAALDPAALGSPESWWSVLLEQMWDGLL
ncbi:MULTISPECIES: SUKH-4 family immunity protein [Streptomyces]|uniref:SUKH-4 family immunity protein n=1 Tax=Streptomyces koelreuteriae TaxID=2838015 RepID=A0ABX8FV66_9ACTN|nr:MULTISPECIES: SUKH-4 family immunity protein [Streptomyces]QWB25105.1 SUKH-4 family immunity protein [Streptomyces koelreuteriae]UUA08138.1 SUKH-4 family immunity protein [Streptomyces koelreuteriae]UUA15745.1 SUKH-4 family immunity protein [Streptomyces sp. CRCS-T-1]